jgi:hypothetical protein
MAKALVCKAKKYPVAFAKRKVKTLVSLKILT